MKYITPLLTSLLVVSSAFSAQASSNTTIGCAAKRQNIERQMEYARAHGNAHRVEGLGIALSKLDTYCTDAGLRAQRESNVRSKERKVEKARQELVEAQADGRQDKIIKRQLKLEEAQAELMERKALLQK